MAFILTGVFTNKGREVLSKGFANLAGFPIVRAKYFKVGMGGWYDTPLGRVPKDPNPSLLDIEATGAPGDVFLQKDLVAADFLFVSPSTMQIRCRLSGSEGNDDGLGNAPRYFEVGVFDDNDNMIIYATFPEQTKSANKVLTNYVQAYF